MPIEKFTLKEPRKYDLPFNGQVFCREEQDGREEWGTVNGVKPVYTTRLNADGKKETVLAGWTASMTTGFRDFRGALTHTATYQASTDWHPAPDEYQMSPAVRALFQAHADEMVRLGDRLLLVESKLDESETWRREERVAAIPAPTPSAPTPTPSAPVTGERPRRGASA